VEREGRRGRGSEKREEGQRQIYGGGETMASQKCGEILSSIH